MRGNTSWFGLVACAVLGATGCGGSAGLDSEGFAPAENDAEYLAQQDQALVKQKIKSSGPFVVFDNPYGDGTANPAAGIEGCAAAAITDRGTTYVTLRTSNLPAGRVFGAHLHRLACADTKGGTHYQNIVAPTTPTDPAYANATNEIWLDFQTGRRGNAFSDALAQFVVRPGEAKAIVVHTNATGAGGVAGAKLACIDLAF